MYLYLRGGGGENMSLLVRAIDEGVRSSMDCRGHQAAVVAHTLE